MTDETPQVSETLPEFFLLLGEAFDAYQAADEFDVHSEDAGSEAEWRALRAKQSHACGALAAYVTAAGPRLARDLATLDEP